MPRGGAFMHKVGRKRLAKTCDRERPAKSQITSHVCLLRKDDTGIREIVQTIRQKYSTVRSWLLYIKDAGMSG